MSQIRTFDSFDDALRFMRAQESVAQERAEDWQVAMKPGDYFVEVMEDGLVVYGEVLEDPEPSSPMRRFVCWYSCLDPDGEMDYQWVSRVDGLLTREQFETARAAGWPSTRQDFLAIVKDDPRAVRHVAYRPGLGRWGLDPGVLWGAL